MKICDVLSQAGQPVAYFSEKLTDAHSRYITYDIEFYVVVRHWRHYLFHCEFILYIDHEAFKHIATQDSLSARHTKWLAFLQQFNFFVCHQWGGPNKVADTLSLRQCLFTDMHVCVLSFDSFRDLYISDAFFGHMLVNLSQGTYLDHTLTYGFLFKGIRLYIHACSLCAKVIS